MATFTVMYHKEGAVEIEADSYEEAQEKFDEMDDSEKEGNAFIGWSVDYVSYANA